MKKFFKIFGIVVGAIVLLIGGFVAWIGLSGIPTYDKPTLVMTVEQTPARLARGKNLFMLMCRDCHFNEETGRLSGKFMAEVPSFFGSFNSANITRDKEHGIGNWSDGNIVALLRTGIMPDGRYSLLMQDHRRLAEEDLLSIVAFLRSDDSMFTPDPTPTGPQSYTLLSKALARFVYLPPPYPKTPVLAPDIHTDKVGYGKYIVQGVVGCYDCHSASFMSNDPTVPEKSEGYCGGGNEMNDATGQPIYTANITPDMETGIGRWTEADFVSTIRTGLRPDKTPLRAPMMRMPELTDEELSAVYAYLRTIPAIHNQRKLPSTAAGANAGEGEKLYYKYACTSCHGLEGHGTCDLRKAYVKYPTNDSLTAWIRDPSKKVPGSKMPTWDGVIQESEYGPLCDYVRLLGERARATASR